jgi:hypothetical protein
VEHMGHTTILLSRMTQVLLYLIWGFFVIFSFKGLFFYSFFSFINIKYLCDISIHVHNVLWSYWSSSHSPLPFPPSCWLLPPKHTPPFYNHVIFFILYIWAKTCKIFLPELGLSHSTWWYPVPSIPERNIIPFFFMAE